MDKKPLDLETMRLKLGRALYDDTFKDPGGPSWLTIPVDVREGFVRMVGVMFNKLFEEDPIQLAEFFVDEGLNKEEFDVIVKQARQTGKTFRMMQQQNAFVQRSALFTLAEAMLQDLDNIAEDNPAISSAERAQFEEYRAALEQIKEAADPIKMRENAALASVGEAGDWKPGAAQTNIPSTILGADGKPMGSS